MSEARPPGIDLLPLSQAWRVDQICHRFENAWATSGRPAIEDFLADTPEPERSALLRELISIDLHYRRRAGDEPQLADYQRRFGMLEATWLAEEVAGRAAGATEEAVNSAGRYQPLRFHAKGALGEVFVARDRELHREVALKRIQRWGAAAPELRRRFLTEAEITARLEHPGIVPVHGLVHDEDGQPCYAMRLIQGESLREAVQRFHDADKPGRDAGERSLALRQLLGRFITVCNTVAYAHSRGVLHRDLKPSNIMLGKYGETLVVDWGLAKAFKRDATAKASAEDTLAPIQGAPAEGTQMGLAVGTPVYMSPEQAAGRWDLVGPASDIYSLGATLYTILTGQMPFASGTPEEVVEKVKQGDFLAPRQWQKPIAPALEAICLKAMAPRPEQRYATALEIATELEHWLADEPVSAWREPWTLRMRRWLGRHRTFVTAAAATTLVATVSLAIATGRLAEANRRAEVARRAEREAKGLAEQNFNQAHEAVKHLTTVSSDLLMEPGTYRLRKKLLEEALRYYKGFLRRRGDNPDLQTEVADTYWAVAGIQRELGFKSEALEAFLRAHDVWVKLVEAYPAETRFKNRLAYNYNEAGAVQLETGKLAEALQSYEKARDLFEELVRANPEDRSLRCNVALSYHGIAALQREPDAALRAYQGVYNIQKKLVNDYPNVPQFWGDLAQTLDNIASLQYDAGQLDLALRSYNDACALREKLVRNNDTWPYNLRDLGASYVNIGNFCWDNDCFAEALCLYEGARNIQEKLVEKNPDVQQFESSLASTYDRIGIVEGAMDDQAAGRRAYQDALVHWERALKFADAQNVNSLRLRRAITLAHLGEHASATAEAAEVLQGGFSHPLNAARVLSLSSAAVRQDAKLSESEQNRLAQQYARRAVDLLSQAQKAGYFDNPASVNRLKKDTDLEPLRSRDDFVKLVTELEEKHKAAAN
jgi:tetratricopeptide (TPR) repeat protein